MKRIYLFLLAFTLMATSLWAKKDDTPDYDYELSSVKETASATSGFKVFKVWSFGPKRQLLTQEIGMRNAIHGLLFKGLVAMDVGTQGAVPALVPDGYDSHKEYFDAFFGNGEYKQFIQLTNRGAQQAGDVMEVSKKRWKVGLLVQVNINALRKRLEKDKIVESATNIFRR
jgi:hypothetical protein